MSDILTEIFPLEIIELIFLFMTEQPLTILYENLPANSTLRQMARSRLLKPVSVRKLGELIRLAKLDTPIGKLALPGKTELLLFLKDNPSFVTGISHVHIDDHDWDESKYSILKEIKFSSYSLEAALLYHFDPSQVPLTLTLLTLQFIYEPTPKRIKGWPSSLTELSIFNHQSVNLIELPLTLKSLSCCAVNGLWHKFPPKLEILDFSDMDWITSHDIEFPKSLRELYTMYCYIPDVQKILDKLPRSLKKLEFRRNEGSDFSSLKFPNSIEYLSLAESDIDSLDGYVFPKSLKALDLLDTKVPPDKFHYIPGVDVII